MASLASTPPSPTNTNKMGFQHRQHSAMNSETTLLPSCQRGLESRNQSQPPNDPLPMIAEPLHHIFTKKQKWCLVCLVSLAGSFSPLSSNIYFPATHSISQQLHVSESLVALTITAYMIVQGIAPSLIGALSDASGRRLTFVLTLSIYVAANFALAFTSSFPMLLALRCVQAAGSAATISISAGVIADIASPDERGGFMGTNAGIRMTGQAIGPVIGGLLNGFWGFRSIFWLLFIFGALVLILLYVFQPETQRKIAGNGSVPVRGFQKPLIYFIKPPKAWSEAPQGQTLQKPTPLSLAKILRPLTWIFEKDIFVLLTWGAFVYTVWSMTTSTLTTSLLLGFPNLTEWQIGLCFLPNGLGCVLGSLITGRLLDQNFKKMEAQYKEDRGLSSFDLKKTKDFPLERARLASMPYFSAAFIVSMALYGPSFELNDLHRFATANLAAPLTLNFMIAFTSTAIFNINSTMLVDCFPEGSASATAANNFCRCLLGAAGVSVIQPLIHAVKSTKAFLILTGVATLLSPLVWVQWRWGAKWRMEREAKRAEKENPVPC